MNVEPDLPTEVTASRPVHLDASEHERPIPIGRHHHYASVSSKALASFKSRVLLPRNFRIGCE